MEDRKEALGKGASGILLLRDLLVDALAQARVVQFSRRLQQDGGSKESQHLIPWVGNHKLADGLIYGKERLD